MLWLKVRFGKSNSGPGKIFCHYWSLDGLKPERKSKFMVQGPMEFEIPGGKYCTVRYIVKEAISRPLSLKESLETPVLIYVISHQSLPTCFNFPLHLRSSLMLFV